MSGLEIAASVLTVISASRKVADGISRLSGLRHAPDVLLALNNEVSDLRCIVEDLSELEQQHTETLNNAVTPSFRRALDRTKEVFLSLQKLLAYDLTTFDDQTGQLRLDRSTWLHVQKKVEQAQLDVRHCRIELSTAIGLLTSLTSIHLCGQTQRFGILLDTLALENTQFCQDVSSRMVGIESQLNNLAEYVTGSHSVDAHASKSSKTWTQPQRFAVKIGDSTDQTAVASNSYGQARSFPTVQFQVLRRRPCNRTCHCSCPQTQRLWSPGFADKIIGNLFLGYVGFPTLFRKCNVLGCRQESVKTAKMTYKFPWWFWQKATNIGFSWNAPDGPELLLRFPCVRPSHCDWFSFARMGDVEGMQYLLERKQASLHDIDGSYGMTALHVSNQYIALRSVNKLKVIVAVHCHKPRASAFLIESRADVAAEDSFGLVPRHCLLFHNSEVAQRYSVGLFSQQFEYHDTVSVDDVLESPPLHICYRSQGNSPAFQIMLKAMSPSGLDEKDVIGETLLFKAIRCSDLSLVQQLLDYGTCVAQKNTHGYAPIALASGIGEAPIVRYLLDHGADPLAGNLWNPDSNAPCYAVGSNRHDVLCLLLEHQSWTVRCHPGRENRANLLHYAACYADVQTLHTLCKVQWITKDVQKLINGMDGDVWTPRRMIESRRLNKMVWASGNIYGSKDRDPEETYEVFMDLIQKIIDDHHSSREFLSSHLYGPPRKRMVPIPRTGTWQWDIIEQDSAREQAQLMPGNSGIKPDIGTSIAVPKLPTKIGRADHRLPFVPKDPQKDYAVDVKIQPTSRTQRDEFEWARYMDGDFVEGGFQAF